MKQSWMSLSFYMKQSQELGLGHSKRWLDTYNCHCPVVVKQNVKDQTRYIGAVSSQDLSRKSGVLDNLIDTLQSYIAKFLDVEIKDPKWQRLDTEWFPILIMVRLLCGTVWDRIEVVDREYDAECVSPRSDIYVHGLGGEASCVGTDVGANCFGAEVGHDPICCCQFLRSMSWKKIRTWEQSIHVRRKRCSVTSSIGFCPFLLTSLTYGTFRALQCRQKVMVLERGIGDYSRASSSPSNSNTLRLSSLLWTSSKLQEVRRLSCRHGCELDYVLRFRRVLRM